jgi:argininosuccinate synthase
LEQLVLDRRTLAAKDVIAPRYADLVYEGRWWTTEREAYDAFVSLTQERVSGSVTLRLFKGTA